MTTSKVATSASAAAKDGEFSVRNPWTGSVAFTVRAGGPAQIESSVRAAKAAFRQFIKTPAHQRASWLNGAAAAMEKVAGEIVEMTIAHIGKPRKAAEMEVKRSIAFIRACATHLHSLNGEVVPIDMVPAGTGLFGFTRRVP